MTHGLFRIATATSLALFAFGGCASRTAYNRVLSERRALERTCTDKNQALSRENKVLYEAKLELEKETSLLSNQMEDLRAQMDAERSDHQSYKESTRQKMKELEKLVKNAEESSSKRIQEMSFRNREVTDSLVKLIDTLSTQTVLLKTRHSSEIQSLKNELTRKKFDYEKEVYALTKMKDELFKKLMENEQRIQQLLADRFSGAWADSAESGPK